MLRASGLTPQCTKQVLDTDPVGRALVACQVGSYEASSVCVACPGGQTSLAGATSAAECYCPAGVFTNCALNGLLVEHAPHSVYVGEALDGSTLPDLSGNDRHAVHTVVSLFWQTGQGLGG